MCSSIWFTVWNKITMNESQKTGKCVKTYNTFSIFSNVNFEGFSVSFVNKMFVWQGNQLNQFNNISVIMLQHFASVCKFNSESTTDSSGDLLHFNFPVLFFICTFSLLLNLMDLNYWPIKIFNEHRWLCYFMVIKWFCNNLKILLKLSADISMGIPLNMN